MLSSSILRLGDARQSPRANAKRPSWPPNSERAHPGLHVELVIFKTSGDHITEKQLHEFGGKGLFTKELEEALLAGQVDFAVHSFKDMPTTMPLVSQE